MSLPGTPRAAAPRKCSECSELEMDASGFCSACDKRTGQPVCETCSSPLRVGAAFCGRCGSTQARGAAGDPPTPRAGGVTKRGGAAYGLVRNNSSKIDLSGTVPRTNLKRGAPTEPKPKPPKTVKKRKIRIVYIDGEPTEQVVEETVSSKTTTEESNLTGEASDLEEDEGQVATDRGVKLEIAPATPTSRLLIYVVMATIIASCAFVALWTLTDIATLLSGGGGIKDRPAGWCHTNKQCKSDDAPWCDVDANTCVSCLEDSHCPSSGTFGSFCGVEFECSADRSCAVTKPNPCAGMAGRVCDEELSACIASSSVVYATTSTNLPISGSLADIHSEDGAVASFTADFGGPTLSFPVSMAQEAGATSLVINVHILVPDQVGSDVTVQILEGVFLTNIGTVSATGNAFARYSWEVTTNLDDMITNGFIKIRFSNAKGFVLDAVSVRLVACSDCECPIGCLSNGVCDPNTFLCSCDFGWTGEDCSVVDPGAPWPLPTTLIDDGANTIWKAKLILDDCCGHTLADLTADIGPRAGSSGPHIAGTFSVTNLFDSWNHPPSGSNAYVSRGGWAIDRSDDPDKLSYIIELFDSAGTWDGYKRLHLVRAETDNTRMSIRLANWAFAQVGFPGRRDRWIELTVSYGGSTTPQGMFILQEEYSTDWVFASGLASSAVEAVSTGLYSGVDSTFGEFSQAIRPTNDLEFDLDAFTDLLDPLGSTKHTKLREFLIAVNDPDTDFAALVNSRMSMDNLIDWLVVTSLLDAHDHVTEGWVLYNPANTHYWYILPENYIDINYRSSYLPWRKVYGPGEWMMLSSSSHRPVFWYRFFHEIPTAWSLFWSRFHELSTTGPFEPLTWSAAVTAAQNVIGASAAAWVQAASQSYFAAEVADLYTLPEAAFNGTVPFEDLPIPAFSYTLTGDHPNFVWRVYPGWSPHGRALHYEMVIGTGITGFPTNNTISPVTFTDLAVPHTNASAPDETIDLPIGVGSTPVGWVFGTLWTVDSTGQRAYVPDPSCSYPTAGSRIQCRELD